LDDDSDCTNLLTDRTTDKISIAGEALQDGNYEITLEILAVGREPIKDIVYLTMTSVLMPNVYINQPTHERIIVSEDLVLVGYAKDTLGNPLTDLQWSLKDGNIEDFALTATNEETI